MKIERIYTVAICFGNAMEAVKHKDTTRDIMASFYEDCIHCGDYETTHWRDLNLAILARWPKGLEYIKAQAHKRFNKQERAHAKR